MDNSYQYQAGDFSQRPWGSWRVLEVFPHSVLKRIEVLPGKRLSLQRHRHRAEHWVVADGEVSVLVGQQNLRLSIGQSVDIPVGTIHRNANEGAATAGAMELQHGSLLSEDDIERVDDDYGRLNGSHK